MLKVKVLNQDIVYVFDFMNDQKDPKRYLNLWTCEIRPLIKALHDILFELEGKKRKSTMGR